MIHVDFDPASLTGDEKTWWDRWKARAEAATLKAVENWESTGDAKLNSAIWKDLKDWLLEKVFHRKCAYCEHVLVRSSPHAEHFRPKGAVTVLASPDSDRSMQKIAVRDFDGSEREHPGYFWLAYEWENLLPSCEFCNSGEGKQNHFPVGGAHAFRIRLDPAEIPALRHPPLRSATSADIFYLRSGDLNEREVPLLLNPLRDRPDEHLVFGDRGVLVERDKSRKGRESIRTFNLKDEELRKDRARAQDLAIKDLFAGMSAADDEDQRRAAARTKLEKYRAGSRPYSAACVSAILVNLPPGIREAVAP